MVTQTTPTSARAWAPDVNAVAPDDAVPDALILATSTIAGTVEGDAPAVRVQYVDDAAAGFVAEGNAIPEADPDLSETLVYTGKVSQLVRLSREQFGQENASDLISESVARAVTKAGNAAYIAQAHPGSTTQSVTITGSPTGGNYTLSGNGATTANIAHNAAAGTVQTAVQALGGGYAAATVTGSAGGPYTVTTATAAGTLTPTSALTGGTTPGVIVTPTGVASTPPPGLLQVPGIVNGGAIAGDLDGLIDLQATLAGNDGMPSHFIVSPTAWASLRKLKRASGSAESLLGVGAVDAVRYLLDLPVLVSNAVPAGAGLIVDKTAVVSAVGDVMVAQSEHAYFNSDSIALRCTWRFGQNVVHPDRVGWFTVTPPA